MIRRRGQEIIRFYRIQNLDGLFQASYLPQQRLNKLQDKSFFVCNNDSLDKQLQRLWEIEKLPNKT
jgi:predicted transposase YdaD